MLRLLAAAAAALAACASGAASPELTADALAADDQCSAGDTPCALNALQLHTRKVAAAANSSSGQPGSCRAYGCSGVAVARPCQCNDQCMIHGNCCSDYMQTCMKSGLHSNACYASGNTYSLDWKAQGSGFFDEMTFVTEDAVHGAQQYLSQAEALEHNVVSADEHGAKLRIGDLRAPSFDGEAYKRYSANIHTNKAWDPRDGVLFVMKYKHVPWGCGLWPGFWTMHSSQAWPAGGELDILEYANYDENTASFHIGGNCQLNRKNTERCTPVGSGHSKNMWDCDTNYWVNKLGCAPRQRGASGDSWASRPGVIVAEWTSRQVTIFHIPELEIPHDLRANQPRPAEWSRWAVAYFEFEGECEVAPQELVLNIQLCGDLAGQMWEKGCGARTGYSKYGGRCVTGLSNTRDCCTQFVTSPKQNNFLQSNAYFDIDYLKVFTANGGRSAPSGTFLRGGVPFK